MAMHDPTNSPRPSGLELALREALSLGRNYAGSEHILLGLEGEQDDVALDADSDLAAVASDASFAVPGALSDHQLKDLIGRLREREHAVSYERRILHAKIDLLRVERVTRLRRRCASES